MKAVLMAGGFGTRIQPLTNSVPKPMLPIVNRPMMEHIIYKLKSAGINDIIVLLYFKPEVIKDYFKDGSDFGVNITYVLPDDDYGTAGAVKCAQKYLDEPFIIASGDLVTDFDFAEIIKFHQKKKSKLTITLTSVEDPLQFGVVITDAKDKIQKFLEKPSWGEVFSDTINTGLYILEPEILNYIPEDENFDFGKDLFPLLMQKEVGLWGYTIKGYWRDVGNPQSYRDVYSDILESKVKMNFSGDKKEFEQGTLYSHKSSDIAKNVKIKGNVVVGKNVKIAEGCELENVVVGDDSIIESKVKIANSVLWSRVLIETKSVIKNAVICNDNKLLRKAKVKSGVIMAENCQIDRNVTFEKDVMLWPDKIVNENSIVSNNIVWGNKYKNSIFENGRVVGRTNIELSCQMATKLAESIGTMLPSGGTVYVSRDYHKSSRMLKRAFLSGLLSTGINVIDLELLPSNVMRFNLAKDVNAIAGIHIRQSVKDQINTEILVFNHEGLDVDTNTSKNIERVFFRESFRRVNHHEIGEIIELKTLKENYKNAIGELLNRHALKQKELRVATDLMFGSTSDIYPDLLNELHVDNIVLNAYLDDKKLSKLPSTIQNSRDNISAIVKNLNLDMGFLIYPNGQKLEAICENGVVIENYKFILVILYLLNLQDKKSKVFLPVWTPDFMDREFKNVEISRGKFKNFKEKELKEFDLIATTNGNYAFTEFSYNADALYCSFKTLELMAVNDIKIHNVLAELKEFFFLETTIECPSNKKGKMMRKFLEDSKDKEASHTDGIKIWINKTDWILMIPAQHSETLDLIIQAKSRKKGEEILKEYQNKINRWIAE